MWQKLKIGERRAAPGLSLALQGGGAHGAYTWGVLDRLLEDGLQIDGISGTSAGAMNAVALAQGWMDGGAEGARESLSAFWQAVANRVPFQMDVLHNLDPNGNGAMPASMNMMLALTRLLSPYQLNPLELNPLRDIMREQFDFERLQSFCPFKLFIAATNVRTGKIRLFHNAELGENALLASACLPTLQQAVEIDGEAYWDGGYVANPAVYPLIYECKTPDILLILLDPLIRESVPRSSREIAARSMELNFSTSFLREMRTITQARSYIKGSASRWLPYGRLERKLMRLRFHLIDADELSSINGISKLNATAGFLTQLRDLGRERTEQWLSHHRRDIGRRASMNGERLFT